MHREKDGGGQLVRVIELGLLCCVFALIGETLSLLPTSVHYSSQAYCSVNAAREIKMEISFTPTI